jgi:hypothetical protein
MSLVYHNNGWKSFDTRQYGEHVDRWVSYYNISRKLATVESR